MSANIYTPSNLTAGTAQVVDLLIRYDGRTDEIQLASIPGVLDPVLVYDILHAAAMKLRTIELAQRPQPGRTESTPPASPG